ncbi:hypothetical protein DRN69_05840 [Candidatus Pacearchaeota archaeon]|nr:MAG: hypothetical protein DRN69_05840 [Candidatus Pacearchaeota archaeon]
MAKSINKKSYWVESPKEIKKCWLKNIKNIGITAGAPTPNYTINEVIAYLKKFK